LVKSKKIFSRSPVLILVLVGSNYSFNVASMGWSVSKGCQGVALVVPAVPTQENSFSA